MVGAEEAKYRFDEGEEKDEDVEYWEQLHKAYRSRHVRSRPAFDASTNIDDLYSNADDRPLNNNLRAAPVLSQDHRAIQMNPTGRYDLSFIDWNGEWENVFYNMHYYFINQFVLDTTQIYCCL